MTQPQGIALARQVRAKRLKEQLYLVNWRSGRVDQYQGINALSDALGMRTSTVRCYLATGQGSFERTLTNPETNEPDIATIVRVPLPAKPKLKRGRPSKHVDNERLFGTVLAGDARVMPK